MNKNLQPLMMLIVITGFFYHVTPEQDRNKETLLISAYLLLINNAIRQLILHITKCIIPETYQ